MVLQRFLPSEFGIDPARMGDAMEPGRVTFDEKMTVRRAIEDAGIPFTYVSANCFAGYFVGGLCQMGALTPSRDKVTYFGSGNVKAVFMDEDDVAAYTVRAADDPRTLNKTVYIRPPENILSQAELVALWEELIDKTLEKTSISEEEFLGTMKELDYAQQVGVGHFYEVLFRGSLTNFEIGEGAEEASKLFPATFLPLPPPQPLLPPQRSVSLTSPRRPAGGASLLRCSSLQTPNPSSVSVDEAPVASPRDSALDDGQLSSEVAEELPPGACKACGKNEIEKGCNGEGRIQGGIATVPGFGWWPIKAYRPCPGFVASGGRYRRRGQSMDEVAFGRGEREASMGSSNKVESSKKKPRSSSQKG